MTEIVSETVIFAAELIELSSSQQDILFIASVGVVNSGNIHMYIIIDLLELIIKFKSTINVFNNFLVFISYIHFKFRLPLPFRF